MEPCAVRGEPPALLSRSGRKNSLPSVRTPSTSKSRSLILRARAVAESLGIAAILALQESSRSGTVDPQDAEVAAEFLEIAIGGDKRGLIERRQGGCKAVNVRNLVKGLEFSSFKCLGKINLDYSNWKLRKISHGLSRRLFPMPLRGQIEDLSPIHYRRQQWGVQLMGLLEQASHASCAGAIPQEVEQRAGIEHIRFGHRIPRSFSIRCSRWRSSKRGGELS